VNDPFGLLGLTPRPLPGQELVREAYFRAAASHHPDAPSGDAAKFAEVKRAFEVLSDPAERLRALAGEGAGGPPDGDLFLIVGAAVGAARKALVAARSPAPLARALASGGLVEARRMVDECTSKVLAARTEAEAELEQLDRDWPGVPPASLLALASKFRFLGKWESELAERQFDLTQAARDILPALAGHIKDQP
jgi:curved DNA-binding protein CbpA